MSYNEPDNSTDEREGYWRSLRCHCAQKLHYLLVVWVVSPLVGGTVHQPGHVEGEHVAEHGGDEPGVEEGLVPEEHGNHGGHDEAADWHQNQIVPVNTNSTYVRKGHT